MQLPSIINIVISELTRGVTQKGFGTVLVLGVHSKTQNSIDTYSSQTVLSDLIAAGFTQYDPIYREVASIVAQTPKPQYVKVGKLTTAFTNIFKLTIADNVVEDKVYSFVLISHDGTETTISYTGLAGDDHEDVAAAFATQISAVTDISAVAVATEVVTCTADNTNEAFYCRGIDPNDIEF